MLLCLAATASAWKQLPPGRPRNVTVDANMHEARITWAHAPSDEGGLATHYAIKWQMKDMDTVEWYPDFVGIGQEAVVLDGLLHGVQYAFQIAAMNPQGRAWSGAVRFTTLARVRCEETFHWSSLLDRAEIERMCGDESLDDPSDPDPRGCSVGMNEYVLAGIAAGATLGFVISAVLLNARIERKTEQRERRSTARLERQRSSASGAQLQQPPAAGHPASAARTPSAGASRLGSREVSRNASFSGVGDAALAAPPMPPPPPAGTPDGGASDAEVEGSLAALGPPAAGHQRSGSGCRRAPSLGGRWGGAAAGGSAHRVYGSGAGGRSSPLAAAAELAARTAGRSSWLPEERGSLCGSVATPSDARPASASPTLVTPTPPRTDVQTPTVLE